MVKTEPNILRSRFIECLWLCYALWGAYYAFFISSAHRSPFAGFLSYTFIGILNIGAGIAQERFWRKQDKRRQQAANSDQNLIAEQQPIQNTTPLPLPLAIAQRIARGWTVVFIVAVILLAVPLIGIAFGLASNITDLLLIFILFVIIGGVFALFVAFPIIRGYQTLVVDEQGISVRIGFGRTHYIRWDEAKLFTISAFYKPGYTINTEMRRLPEYYEVSSTNDVVRWRWVRIRNFVAIEPALPVAEYDRQMQAVLALVAAKTGLTLYDVRPREQRL